MKTIFTLDSKTRLTPAAYDSIKAVIEREGYKATLGLMKHTLGYKTCVMVEGDIDATMFCVKIARSYGEKELVIVNDFDAHIYRLHTQEMITTSPTFSYSPYTKEQLSPYRITPASIST